MTEKLDQSTKFGPEWLAFTPEPSIPEEENAGRFAPNGNASSRKPPHSASRPKREYPYPFGRSKSSPLLLDDEARKENESVFRMLKERNDFDKNFPTLMNNRKAPSVSVPTEKETAWKQASDTPKSSTASAPTSSSSSPDNSRPPTPTSLLVNGAAPSATASVPEHDKKSQADDFLCGLVPSTSVPKTLQRNRVELVTPQKKASRRTGTRVFDPNTLRKACSEPALPLTESEISKYQLKLMKTKVAPVSTRRTKDPAKPATTRTDFLQSLQKKEEQKKQQSDGSLQEMLTYASAYAINKAAAAKQAEGGSSPSSLSPDTSTTTSPTSSCSSSPTLFATITTPSSIINSSTSLTHPVAMRPGDKATLANSEANSAESPKKPAQWNPEEEDRFLRELGWEPNADEEELTEEEILQVQLHQEPNLCSVQQ